MGASGVALAQSITPGTSWRRPRASHWSKERLAEARRFFESTPMSGLMIVQNGDLIDAWGDVSHKFNIHSARKSLLSALYGPRIQRGEISMSTTLEQLGIDDRPPRLSREEKQATILDLLMVRSGVYHDAAAESDGMRNHKPPRHSKPHGTFWCYNNWDFNTAGAIFEKLTRTSIFKEFERVIARPIGMEDFSVADCRYQHDPSSQFPAYIFHMTARDMARFGLLMLRGGEWNGRTIVPRKWVEESTKSYSDASGYGIKGDGYGYMWWVRSESYSARGNGGQYIDVVPSRSIVITQTSSQPVGSFAKEFFKLEGMILAAERG